MKNQRNRATLNLLFLLLVGTLAAHAQLPNSSALANATTMSVPRLVKFSGTLKDLNGSPLSGVVGATFALYSEQNGGAPLWLETQNVQADNNGRYMVLLGATKSDGLPADLFSSAQAQWVGVQPAGQNEQPRVMLVSAPYALKSADADTIGGLPPSAFVLATAANGGAASSPSQSMNYFMTLGPALGGSGTTNFIPIWTNSTTLGNSILYQTGGNVGIGNSTPASKLDVSGGAFIRGTLKLPSTGTATPTQGFASYPTDLQASAFNSGPHMAMNQTFRWQSEPTGNNTSSPSGTLNLLFGSGNTNPTETGLKISKGGIFTFASGQTFPGTGTITGVTAGKDLTGGGTSGNVTLNLDTTKVPQLNASNSFSGNQSITGNVNVSGDVSAATLDGLTITDFAFQFVTNHFVSGQYFQGNGREMLVGDPGCGSGFAGIGFGNLSGCNNYSMIGDGNNTYINRPAGGFIHFREGNNEQMMLRPGGLIWIGSPILGAGLLDVEPPPAGTGQNGATAIGGVGGNADLNAPTIGGDGIDGFGGEGGSLDGNGGSFVGGSHSQNGDGVFGLGGTGYAGNFQGNIQVTGAVFAGTKDFRIDHPLDPANKYLYHASVESSEMMDIYTGNVTTDEQGNAAVELPDWFEAINGDFRYQLTVIGQFAQAIVASKIANHQFGIKTDKPNVEVSWQVTAVRQDAFAKAHPLQVEVEKNQGERGFYIHPELYGQPNEKQLEWARHPEMMKRVKETRAGR